MAWYFLEEEDASANFKEFYLKKADNYVCKIIKF